MRSRRYRRTIGAVTPSEPSHLSVEVDRSGDPITGHVRTDGGLDLTFVGWLGLIAALDRVLTVDLDRQEKP